VFLYTVSQKFCKDYSLQLYRIRFEVLTTVTMKNDVVWDVTPCGFCKNIAFFGRLFQLIVIANVLPNSLNLLTQMMEAIRSSETSALTRDIGRNIQEDCILNSTGD
jgi:hypothetical protein